MTAADGAVVPTRIRLLVCVVVLLVAGLSPAATARAESPQYQFAPSGLDGAGFQNVVVFSPFVDDDGFRPLLLGADVAGVHRSLDGGRNWLPSNAGLGDQHVASLLFSAAVPGKVYAATDSALYVSTDFGMSWSRRAGAVRFDANGVYHLNSQEHPRATGTLLAEDTSGPAPLLYAATATQGVKRSSDDGATWEKIALAGDHLRSIALDPANPDTLYVGDANNGLQVSTDARAGMTFSRAPGGPAVPEELTFVGGALYVAGGTAGIFRYDGTWHPLANGVPAGPAWQSITGYVDPDTGRPVLFAGCARPTGGQHTLRSTDGGASWVPISTGAGVTLSAQEYGQDVDWWAAGKNYLAFAGQNFVSSQIAVDPDDHDTVVVAGRGGAYVATLSPSGVAWSPAVRGLMATVGMVAVADPRLPGRVYVGLMDWTFVASANNGRSFIGDAVPAGAPTTGDVIALDPDVAAGSASTVYLAASQGGGGAGGGHVYSNPDPIANPAGWTDEGLPSTNDILALGVGHDAAGSRIILAAVTGRGLYRKVGATWTLLSGTAPFPTGKNGTFAWVPGTPVVYAMDDRGIWRSDSAGAPGSWTKLVTASAGYLNASSLVPDPAHPGVIYVSDADLGGVVRFTGADTAGPVRTTILPLSDPGPIALTPTGALLAQDRGGHRLMRSPDPTVPTPAFEDATGSFFAANDPTIRSMSVGPDGFVYTASNHAGVTVAPPTDGPVPPADDVAPSSPAGLTSPSQTDRTITLTWDAATDDVGVAYYQVVRGAVVVGATTGALTYTDSGLNPATAYSYSVRAVDAAGNRSAPTDALPVTTAPPPPDTTPPTAPRTLAGRVLSPTQVMLSWQSSSDDVGVTGYRVSRDGLVLATGTALSFTDNAATAGSHTYTVEALDAAGNVSPASSTAAVVPAAAPRGLTGTYFDTATLTTQRLVRTDPAVSFAWGTGPPAPGVGADTFSVRWTGRLLPTASGSQTFYVSSDDGARLWIDGVRIVDDWTAHSARETPGTVTLTADRAHDITLEYYDRTGTASVKLSWSGPGFGKQIVPAAQLLSR